MRFSGVALFLLGLVATIICSMHGCGTFFSWNGRHTLESQPLIEERTHATFTTVAGRRYTISVQAVFDPRHVDEKDGMAEVDAKMSLSVKAKDQHGTSLAEATGWLDKERPNIFYSRPLEQPGREIMVERLVGPFNAANVAPVTIDVDLGPDRVARNVIVERRLVIYDDALPPTIRNAALGAVLGIVALVAGFVLLVMTWARSRSRRRKRSGVPRVPVV